jgi:transposase
LGFLIARRRDSSSLEVDHGQELFCGQGDRVAGFVDAGHSRHEAARRFGVSASFAIKLDARRRETVRPSRRWEPSQRRRQAGPASDFLIGRVKAQPDITMPELAGQLAAERGVEAAPASISRVLRNAGFTYKKSPHGRGAWTRRRR